jgi:acyl-CoA synthetase (AMP-forming)/AMP-acid ligase II
MAEILNSASASIAQVLTRWAKQQPDHVLLFAPETDQKLSYGQMALEAEHFMGWLKEHQISAKGHVGIFMHNGRQTTTVFITTMVCGRVVTPLNLLAPVDQLAWVLDHSDIEVLFYAPENKQHLFAALKKTQRAFELVELDPDAESGPFLQSARSPLPQIDSNIKFPDWYYANVSSTEQLLKDAGFVDIQVSLRPHPTPLPDKETLATYLKTLVFREWDASQIAKMADLLTDNTLDYVRLEVRANKA